MFSIIGEINLITYILINAYFYNRRFIMLHHMKLQPGPFDKSVWGKKTIELRFSDDKKKLVNHGEQI